MSELSGQRVVGKRPAPTLDILFVCDECGCRVRLDAYEGPPSCSGGSTRPVHLPTFMTPLRLADADD